jgi:hypothetical protein
MKFTITKPKDELCLDYKAVNAVMFGDQWHNVVLGSAYVTSNAYFVEGTYTQGTKLVFKNQNGFFVVDLDDVQAYRFELEVA